MKQYTCPSCGYRVFGGPPGTEDLCPICGWRDDMMQLRFPNFVSTANGVSLYDAQLNYELIGAKDTAAVKSVRSAQPSDERDSDWRRIDTDADDLPDPPVDFDGLAEPDDTTALYYWLPT